MAYAVFPHPTMTPLERLEFEMQAAALFLSQWQRDLEINPTTENANGYNQAVDNYQSARAAYLDAKRAGVR